MRKNKDAFNAYRKQYHRDKRAYVLVSTAKRRALKRGLPFDLDTHRAEIQARIDAGVCEVSGVKFDLRSGRTYASPSIDRIVPNQGYVYSNIRIVCNLINMALGDWGEETLYAVLSIWQRQRQGETSGREDETRAGTDNQRTPIVSV